MFEVKSTAAAAIVYVSGEVDLAYRDELCEVLSSALAESPRLIVSLEKCTYMDSTGIGVLVRMRDSGKPLNVVVEPGSQIERIVGILQLGEYLGLVPTLDAALATTGFVAA